LQEIAAEVQMTGKSIHVVPAGDEWIVEEEGQQLSTHATQKEAADYGRVEAVRLKAELVVHGRDGRVEWKNSYGHDPRDVTG
jgi:hypothetical protein